MEENNFMYDILPDEVNSLEELEAWKSKFDNLTYYQRKVSNEMSLEKFGKNNIDRYNEMKATLINTNPEDRFEAEFDVLSAVGESVSSDLNIINHDDWEAKLAKAREAEAMGLIILIDTRRDEEMSEYDLDELYYIKDKYEQFMGLSQDKRSLCNQTAVNIFGFDNYTLYQKIMNAYLNRADQEAIPSEEDDKPLSQDALDVQPYFNNSDTQNSISSETPVAEKYIWARKLQGLSNILECTDNVSKRESIKEEMRTLGWNPEIPFTLEAASNTWMRNTSVKEYEFVDLTQDYMLEASKSPISRPSRNATSEKLKDKIVPVFVVLVSGKAPHSKGIEWFTDSEWSHASMGFNSDLKELYSFNLYLDGTKIKNGFAIEGIDTYKRADPNMRMKVHALFVTPEQRDLMKDAIQWYMDNQDSTSYNFGNLLNIALRKVVTKHAKDKDSMICSQFVYTILRLADFKTRKYKDNNFVTPADIDDLANDARFYVVYDGRVKDYDYKIVDTLCYALLPTLPLELFGIEESTGNQVYIPKSSLAKSNSIDRVFAMANLMLKNK